MGEPEENGRKQHHGPGLQSYMDEDGHGEPAIEEFLAKPGRNRKREIGEQLHRGLRQGPLRDGLKRAARLGGNSPYTTQVEPLKSRDGRGTDNRSNKDSGLVRDSQ